MRQVFRVFTINQFLSDFGCLNGSGCAYFVAKLTRAIYATLPVQKSELRQLLVKPAASSLRESTHQRSEFDTVLGGRIKPFCPGSCGS